jgi:tRNA dimethylallyltransferase
VNKPLSKAIFLRGPTASGKTGLAIELVQRFPLEIISVDSALVYRGMDIGTAKPTADELARAPHHLIDFQDPADPYSAARFRDDALRLMGEITQRGNVPLLVGGTMLYFRALESGLSDLPEADESLRARLLKEQEDHGLERLYGRLKRLDPESAERIKPGDPQRIMRALEVYELTGKPLSAHYRSQETYELPYQVLNLALIPSDRSRLHQRIEARFDQMLEQGLIDEVKALYERGDLNVSMPAIRAVGYRQAWAFLEGEYDLETMRYKGIVATRQLAKRQLTWLRSMPDLLSFDSETLELQAVVDSVLAFLEQ